jgi:hypothetical protein
VATLDAFDRTVVDDATDPAIVAALRSKGIDVQIAGPTAEGRVP